MLCIDNVIKININNPPFDKNDPPSECLVSFLARIYFIAFVMISEYVLINIVVAVLLKHLEVFYILKCYCVKLLFDLKY